MTQSQPMLTTERLLLRPLQLSDAKKIQSFAGDIRIANGTISVPHPYVDGIAGQWIGKHLAGWLTHHSAMFAITLKSTQQLVGCAGIENIDHDSGQLGYWIGVPYWGNGYCTEAVSRLKEYGFKKLHLTHLYGRHNKHMTSPANVMRKIGMEPVSQLSVNYRQTSSSDYALYEITASHGA